MKLLVPRRLRFIKVGLADMEGCRSTEVAGIYRIPLID